MPHTTRTDNAIKNHWNSSMKRRIERYLSNNDRDQVPLLDDGRYYFHGDLEGVLMAVRDNDENSKGRPAAAPGGPVRNSRRNPRRAPANGREVRTPARNAGPTTFSRDFSARRSTYANSASRNLFEDTASKLWRSGDDDHWDSDVANNIFVSPPPSDKKRGSDEDGKADSDQKRQLRSTFTAGRASIMETPKDKGRPPAVGDLHLRGFTPLSKDDRHHQGDRADFAEILDQGLFSPGWPLGRDVAADSNDPNNVSALSASFAEGVKTPNTPKAPPTGDRHRMCIANVRFADDPDNGKATTAKRKDRMQREVAISPICQVSLSALGQRRKRRSLFGDDLDEDLGDSPEKKRRSDGAGSSLGMTVVTPAFSVRSNSTVTTLPLTVCSSASSVRTTRSLEELSKVRPVQIVTSSLQAETDEGNGNVVSHSDKDKNNTITEDCVGMEPKHITQDTPSPNIADDKGDVNRNLQQHTPKHITQSTPSSPATDDKGDIDRNLQRHADRGSSPPFSPPPDLNMAGCTPQSAKKPDVGTPAEKFWSSVGGLDSFTPYRAKDGDGATGPMSPASNSKYFRTLLEEKGSASKADKPLGSVSKADKSVGSASKADKSVGSASKADKSVGSVSKADKSVGSASKADKSVGSASKADKSVPSAAGQ